MQGYTALSSAPVLDAFPLLACLTLLVHTVSLICCPTDQIALPTLLDDHRDDDSPSSNDTSISERTKVYTVSHNLLVSAADAIERIMSSYKTVVELSGYTGRVYNMLAVFDDVHNGVYKKADASTLPIDLAPGVVHEGADEVCLIRSLAG